METISRSLLTFLLNSLWQIPLAALVAALACRMLRRGPASHRHAVWVAALIAAGQPNARPTSRRLPGGRRRWEPGGRAACPGAARANAGCQNRLLRRNYGERPVGGLSTVCALPI